MAQQRKRYLRTQMPTLQCNVSKRTPKTTETTRCTQAQWIMKTWKVYKRWNEIQSLGGQARISILERLGGQASASLRRCVSLLGVVWEGKPRRHYVVVFPYWGGLGGQASALRRCVSLLKWAGRASLSTRYIHIAPPMFGKCFVRCSKVLPSWNRLTNEVWTTSRVNLDPSSKKRKSKRLRQTHPVFGHNGIQQKTTPYVQITN